MGFTFHAFTNQLCNDAYKLMKARKRVNDNANVMYLIAVLYICHSLEVPYLFTTESFWNFGERADVMHVTSSRWNPNAR